MSAVNAHAAPVLILAGGTGGHIFPGIAVAQALQARGVPVGWLGSKVGLEGRLVPDAGIALVQLGIGGVRGKGFATLLRAPFRLGRAVAQAMGVMRQQRPRAVVSFGGFAAGPGGLAARLLGIPLLVHEQNRAPGLTNRVLARIARRVLCAFPGTFGLRPATVVGNPVRAVIAGVADPAVRLAERSGPVRLLVLGGSQGARALNRGLPAALRASGVALQVRHQCGARHEADTRAAYAEADIDADVAPFIADMAEAYAWADLVVCRAGALTLSELAAAGVASVLVPLPTAADDHQTRNAEWLVEAGAARLVAEGDDFTGRLAQTLRSLCGSRDSLRAMAVAARRQGTPDAAGRVADIVLEESVA